MIKNLPHLCFLAITVFGFKNKASVLTAKKVLISFH